ncbi:MAG TPA: NAD-dependent epimerase/dehydratase family protein, partial [Nitrosarchaeum sp.]|nr:NAD-dependent epimerase/dehydratase family protein [Nitrosarchaeum sp.]
MSQKIDYRTSSELSPYSILVTGATGFIGSRLISILVSLGFTVKGMSRRDLSDIHNVKYVQSDVFDVKQLEKAMT